MDISVSKEKTPFLKFLLWSNPDITSLSKEKAKRVYFSGERFQRAFVIPETEKKIMEELNVFKK